MSPQEIQNLLGQVIYNRAKNYYNNEAVLNIEIKGPEVRALVDGSDYEPYEIFIDFKKRKFQCNCPYGSYCKHIGAVLLTLTYEYSWYFSNDSAVPNNTERLDDLKNEISSKADRVIQLNGTYPDFPGRLYIYGKNNTSLSSQRYRLVFLINEKATRLSENEMVISPGLQYLKKDGSWGRIENYSDSRLSEPINDTELKLLNVLSDYENSQGRLSLLTPFVDTINEITCFKGTNAGIPLDFKPVHNFRISFSLKGLRNQVPVFNPVITLNPGGEVSETVSADQITADSFNLFAVGENTAYYSLNNINSARLFRHYLNSRYFYFIEDINQLREEIKRNFDGDVSLDFSLEKITLKSIVPDCIIELGKAATGLAIRVLFRYSARTCSYTDEDDFLILHEESSNEEVITASRDKKYEKLLASRFEDHFEDQITKLGSNFSNNYYPRQFRAYRNDFDYKYEGTLFTFLADHASKLMEMGYEIRLKDDDTPIRSSAGRVSSNITSGIDWFDINTSLVNEDGDSESFEIDPFLLDYGLVKGDGGYTFLTKEDIEYLLKIKEEGADEKGSIRVNKLDFDLIENIYLRAVGDVPDEAERIHGLYEKLKDFKKIKSYPLPKKFGTKLRRYQKAGYNWLQFLRQYDLNGCLADDMGLGKTVQTLALLQKLKEEGALETSLVVVPVTTLANWENELRRFTNNITWTCNTGQRRLRDKEALLEFDIILTSYHTLRNDIELFSEMNFYYLILDESHYIKNSASQAFRAVRSIRSRHRLGLSGTPIENNTMELWSQMDFLNPGLLGNRKEFSRRFAKPIEKYGNSDAADKLKKLVYPFILRRKKEEVATDLPEKEEIILYSEMDTKQRKLYEGLKKLIREEVKETIDTKGKDSSSIEIFAALMRLRQLALLPALISDEYSKVESAKFEQFKNLIDEILAEDHKVLIFSQFVTVLKYIESHIKSSGYKYSYIDGSTQKRADEISRFQNEDDCKIFLLSIKAGGVGINLTSADYVIIFDPWWNPAVESQAIDRAHRIGQTRKVIAYKMITRNTIEEKMIELQNRKKKLVQDVITEEGSFFKSMNRDDIIELFE